ncbi:MAG: hypothetical protein ACP5LG_04925 [Conexivisphaera sp.]
MPDNVPRDLRDQLRWAKERVDSQLQRLNRISDDVDRRERALFERVVSLSRSGQTLRAEKHSEELSQLRKLRDTVRAVSATLDAVSLKLEGAVSLGDAVAALSSARTAVSSLSRQVRGMSPDVDKFLAEVDDVLSSTQQAFSEIQIPVTPDAERIIEEASAVADLRRGSSLPEPELQPQ